MIKGKTKRVSNKTLSLEEAKGYVAEARESSQHWRAESWRDCEMYDGDQWSAEEYEKAKSLGIDPLTINRTFPAINLILGSQEINQANIIAKGRTSKDGKIADIMTEAIAYVIDQNQGRFLIKDAFKDSVVAGFGCLYVGFNPDPRREKIQVARRDWKEIFFDPYADPWLNPEHCRYAFHQRWLDAFELKAMYPEHAKAIDDVLAQSGEHQNTGISADYAIDPADEVEQDKRVLSSARDWCNPDNRRVRPVQLWYPVLERGLFALFADGRCVEVDERALAPEQVMRLVKDAQELIKTTVRKLRVKTFVGDIELDDRPSPFAHNLFPFVPFVGYVDRRGNPYGVPRMIRGQNIEVNRRRSMNLALLNKKQVIMESDVSDHPQIVYEELNKLDGFAVVKPNTIGKIMVRDGVQVSQYQLQVLEQSEKEIQQISGANDEAMGYRSNASSGKAIELRRSQSSTIMSPVFGNLHRSLNQLGTLIISNVQSSWTGEKVLRVTDKMTNAERFVTVNQRQMSDGGVIEIRNDVTQGQYDIIVSDAPATDTVREQNMQLLIEWCKQAPQELIPYLMGMALEMSNVPNKDQLMTKLKPMMGLSGDEMDMSPEQIKQQMQQQAQQQAEEAAQVKMLQQKLAELGLTKAQLENMLLQAQIAKTNSDAGVAEREQSRKELQTGVDAGEKIRKARQDDLLFPDKMVQEGVKTVRRVTEKPNEGWQYGGGSGLNIKGGKA